MAKTILAITLRTILASNKTLTHVHIYRTRIILKISKVNRNLILSEVQQNIKINKRITHVHN